MRVNQEQEFVPLPHQMRSDLMRICAQATRAELAVAVEEIGLPEGVDYIREPELGLVMLRGRISGDGQPFNVGEASVTRAAVRFPDGATGFSYILGRDVEKARLAAIVDALAQTEEYRARLDTLLAVPVAARTAKEVKRKQQRAAATRVEFFTMVRGED